MNQYLKQISHRLSLRKPQQESLEILAEILEIIELDKDNDEDKLLEKLKKIKNKFPTVEDFEKEFPSICFALATGVGKTRLMGAFITYLNLSYGVNNFFVLAPNLTIYNKLIKDFTPNTSKYVFNGISNFATQPPCIITGENYEQSTMFLLDENLVRINIFNVSKINSEVRSTSTPKIKRLSEYIGESYFEYLSSLPDLVLIMDESHRYRASAGVKALNELNPVLGLELTATPQVEKGRKSVSFKNVIYSYPLYKAMEDGYVKEPTVATRENFDVSNYSTEELERLKLEDGILIHEETKVELEVYARERDKDIIRPFILIVAQDTSHAESLMEIIKSKDFYEGTYKNKVITVHSKQSGEEKDETILALLALENPDSNIEIVIHVNKLKEGWDVSNLYTLIPLRAASSKTLVEQSIGRGLRLPYGKRTNVKNIDRLTIIAHDRFQDIIDEANNPDSIIRKGVVIGRNVATISKKVISVESTAKQNILQEISGKLTSESLTPCSMETKRKIADMAINVIRKMENIPRSSHLMHDEIKKKITLEIKAMNPFEYSGNSSEISSPIIDDVINVVIDSIVERTMDIPKISLSPKEEVRWEYGDFDLDVSNISLQPVVQDILIQELRTRKRSILKINENSIDNDVALEHYLISQLSNYDDISYEDHVDLLYKLVRQLITHLKSYLNNDNDVRNVLIYNQQLLAAKIHNQMLEHYVETRVGYDVVINSDFEVLSTNTYSIDINEEIRDFQVPVEERSGIKGMSFGGFERCLYPIQKFDAENERRFAVICEQDDEVEKWFKPSQNQLKILYNKKQNYTPDFVVETRAKKYLVELKDANKIENDKEVRNKSNAAIEWCKHATAHELIYEGKEWRYILIPHTVINENMTLEGLDARFRQSNRND